MDNNYFGEQAQYMPVCSRLRFAVDSAFPFLWSFFLGFSSSKVGVYWPGIILSSSWSAGTKLYAMGYEKIRRAELPCSAENSLKVLDDIDDAHLFTGRSFRASNLGLAAGTLTGIIAEVLM